MKPMRGILLVCCASAESPVVSSRMNTAIENIICAFRVSSNHSVCARQHARRNRQPDLFHGLHIDHQVKLAWLFDRQISWLGTLENFMNVDCSAPLQVEKAWAIGHQTTSFGPFAFRIYGRYPM